ncbi:MAG: YopT-type cysteine protease domain-containing protein [Maricaulaceae bacterium]
MTVLTAAPAIDWQLDMPYIHQKLHAMAITHGGACTKKFRQGSDDVTKGVGSIYHLRLKSDGKKWGGVCKALSMFWMAFHANDEDFWSWLFGKDGKLNVERAAFICDLHGSYSSRPDHGDVQTRQESGLSKLDFMKKQLAKSGIVPRTDGSGGSLSTNMQAFTKSTRTGRGREIAKVLAPPYKMGGAMYKQLSFAGDNGAHATVAWIAQDAMFFDPNYGEYWFEKVSDFARWFELYWRETGYGAKYTKNFTIHCFGKKA